MLLIINKDILGNLCGTYIISLKGNMHIKNASE